MKPIREMPVNSAPFPHDEGNVFKELLSESSEIFQEFIRKHNLAVDQLTGDQLAEALRQAIACGDFQRLVRVDNSGQQVIYIPFAREQELKTRIKVLEAVIIGISKSQ